MGEAGTGSLILSDLPGDANYLRLSAGGSFHREIRSSASYSSAFSVKSFCKIRSLAAEMTKLMRGYNNVWI